MKRRRRFAFRKTTAILVTCALIGATAIAINAIGTEKTAPQETKITLTSTPEATQEATETPIKEPEASAIQAITEQPKPAIPIYNIPLSEELQTYTFNLCEEYGVDYEMVLAMMDKESSYRPGVISKSDDYGLMQINTINHETLKEALRITDLLDPEQNILCGIYLIGRLTAKYEDPHRILMAYNMGERGAREYVEKGNISTAYSRAIMELREELLQQKGEKK